MLRSKRFLLSTTMTMLFIIFFILRTDLGEVWGAIAQANHLYVLPAIPFYGIALLWRTSRWQVILSPLGKIPFARLWPVIAVGYAANNVIPVRLGELIRAYYLSIREGTSKTSALATIIIERVFDGLALLFLVGIVSLFVPVVGLFRDLGEQAKINWLVLTLGLSVPFFLTTAAIILISFKPSIIDGLTARLLRLLPQSVRARASDFISRFLAGLAALSDPTKLSLILVLSIPVWLSETALYYMVALGFGIEHSLSSHAMLAGVLVLTTATSNLGTSIPSTAGGIGPFEFFTQATLIHFGVASATASAYAIVLHATLLIPITILGLVHIWINSISLNSLAKQSQSSHTLD